MLESEIEENRKKFNEKIDTVTVFLRKVLNCELTIKDIEKRFLRFVKNEIECLLNLVHRILLDLEIFSKIEFCFKMLIILISKKGQTDLDEIMYIFEYSYLQFKYIYEHTLLESSFQN